MLCVRLTLVIDNQFRFIPVSLGHSYLLEPTGRIIRAMASITMIMVTGESEKVAEQPK